ncbi:MAG: hypothetical protein DMG82_20700 [Acidobacteria bacterium]|nr:MAG: hypothetical protein DMG82_20700 [Acidobacteriota bacterium]
MRKPLRANNQMIAQVTASQKTAGAQGKSAPVTNRSFRVVGQALNSRHILQHTDENKDWSN